MFDLFNQPPDGDLLRDIGIATATTHAELVSESWTQKAYWLLSLFIEIKPEFTCEEFREWCKFKIDSPPSLRAFGGIINRAARRGLIEQVSIVKVTNPKAHRANAALWKRK